MQLQVLKPKLRELIHLMVIAISNLKLHSCMLESLKAKWKLGFQNLYALGIRIHGFKATYKRFANENGELKPFKRTHTD